MITVSKQFMPLDYIFLSKELSRSFLHETLAVILSLKHTWASRRSAAKYSMVLIPWTIHTGAAQRDAAQQNILWGNILLPSKMLQGLQPIKIRQGNGYDFITGRFPRPFSTRSYNVAMEEKLIASVKPSGHKYYLNVIWTFNFGRNILDQLFQQCSGPNIPGMFLFDVIWMFNFDWNVMHQKWTFLQPSSLNIPGMFRVDTI